MWIKEPHRCTLPLVCHGEKGKVGNWYECDHCKAEWRVQARVPHPNLESFYLLTFVRRVGDYQYTISHLDL